MNLHYFIILFSIFELISSLNDEKINVGITFTKAYNNENLRNKFKVCVSSMLKYATIDINFYVIGDQESQIIAKKIFSSIKYAKIKYEVLT